MTRIDRAELLSVENPNYAVMISKYPHLKGVYMEDTDLKKMLPVHVILGASDYARIKTRESQRTGAMGEPVAEYTRFGWTIMSPGTETDLDSMFLAQTASNDYEELYRMDVLGLEDAPSGDQSVVYAEFREQLRRSPDGWYEARLPWKGDHPPLPSNESGSLKHLGSLVQRLKKTGCLDEYDAIIQDQLREGIVEEADMPASGKEFYIPHKAVVRENVESTKMRVVYDASAKAHSSAPSLNDRLEVGPPLQNKLWKVLVRGRFHPVALAGDIRKAFLQVRIHVQDRDALRFHWLEAKDPQRIRTYRFTRALFSLGPSPFLLGGVIQQHLNTCRDEHPKCVEEIERELYVDDILSGGPTTEEVKQKKATTTEIFAQATFHLHKWHSNVKELELDDVPEDNAKELEPVTVNEHEDDLSYAKQQLGVQSRQCGLLGLKWNKLSDEIGVPFPANVAQPTKRGILGKVAKIYDPLGLAAPTTLQGKLLYREACEEKCAWDAPLSAELVQQWKKWESCLPQQINCPRALTSAQQPIENIELHAFGDASGKGVAAAVYAVVKQPTSVNQGLVTAKARLAKQGLTIPRRELVSGHMAVNLLSNVQDALQGFPVSSLHCWLDSSVALHWIRGNGDFKQFVANRVRKIREHGDITWRHVPTKDNPADLASRGGPVTEEKQLWWKGPAWLSDPRAWLPDLVTVPTAESNAEAKVIKEVLATALSSEDEFSVLMEQHSLLKALRVCAWVSRFLTNSRNPKPRRVKGPLTTDEMKYQETWWTRRAQEEGRSSKNFEADKLQLNLQPDNNGILECRGRIVGAYPIYLPDGNAFTHKLVQRAHLATLHGGVTLTMTKVRETHWIPRLRKLTKKVIKSCWGCKRFRAQAYQSPPPGNLPTTRTQGVTPYETIGVDFAGPIKYQVTKKMEGKAYLALYACGLTRGVYLDLLPSLETSKFLTSLKGFIARRGRPRVIYSDNGSTFKAAADWLRKAMKDEKFHTCLSKLDIAWRFNLSRAPWWGGQFERLIGVFKSAFRKAVGNGTLSWGELSDVVLDVEIAMNGRPLSYLEEDVELPVLTPSSMLHLRPSQLPELNAYHIEEPDLRKRAKYLYRCKEAMWSRWTKEYVRSLRERHSRSGGKQTSHPSVGEVVIIQDESRNRNSWKLGIVERLIVGRDGIVRGAKLRAGKGVLERAVQQLYPLELSCDRTDARLNPEAEPYRPRRDAAVAARHRIADAAQEAEP